jgi:hypothetical protein
MTDGPFAEPKEQLGGFRLLECENLDEALEWARKVPLRSGAIEIRPVIGPLQVRLREQDRESREGDGLSAVS